MGGQAMKTTMNKYITAPLNYEGLNFEIKTFKWGWQAYAVFPSGNKVTFRSGSAIEVNSWITDMTTAYTEGKKEITP
jgi:hypothetical protein